MFTKKISWSAEKYQRLLVATLAAHPQMKLNYNTISGMFGEGATYDSIEMRYRVIKKQAKVLVMEIENGERPGETALTPRKRKAIAAAAAREGLNPSPTKKERRAPVTPPRRRQSAVKLEENEGDETPGEPWGAAGGDETELDS